MTTIYILKRGIPINEVKETLKNDVDLIKKLTGDNDFFASVSILEDKEIKFHAKEFYEYENVGVDGLIHKYSDRYCVYIFEPNEIINAVMKKHLPSDRIINYGYY